MIRKHLFGKFSADFIVGFTVCQDYFNHYYHKNLGFWLLEEGSIRARANVI